MCYVIFPVKTHIQVVAPKFPKLNKIYVVDSVLSEVFPVITTLFKDTFGDDVFSKLENQFDNLYKCCPLLMHNVYRHNIIAKFDY